VVTERERRKRRRRRRGGSGGGWLLWGEGWWLVIERERKKRGSRIGDSGDWWLFWGKGRELVIEVQRKNRTQTRTQKEVQTRDRMRRTCRLKWLRDTSRVRNRWGIRLCCLSSRSRSCWRRWS